MPFYRNLGAIRFQAQIKAFQIFKADPDTTIFQSKSNDVTFLLQTLVEHYQRQHHSNDIQFYHQANKGASIVIPQCKPAQLTKASIDDLCKALLKATKVIIQICSLFPQLIGDLEASQYRFVNGKLAFIYLPTTEIKDRTKRDIELVKGVLKLASQINDVSNMSHKLLLKKISKCKNVSQIHQQINYFYSVYGVGTKSNKLNQGKQQKHLINKNRPQLKLNLFKSNSKGKCSHGKLSLHSNSLHSSFRKNNSFNLWIDKNKHNSRTVSNSCSTRKSPFFHSKINTIDLNTSFHSAEDKLNRSKLKKTLKKSKINLCEDSCTPVSSADQQKLLKKLHKKKTEHPQKKLEFKNELESKVEKQQSMNLIKQNSIKQDSRTQISKNNKLKSNFIESNIVSIKFPSKAKIEQPQQIDIQSRTNPSKAIHKNQPPTLSTQPSQKKLKKKPVLRQQQWGSELEIVQLQKQSKEVSKVAQPKEVPNSMNETKEIHIPKINIEASNPKNQQGLQTRKNSWNVKLTAEETVRKTKKLSELLQKKKNIDYMGQAVVNTTNYLSNFQKIFWQLPLFFIYRSFYLLRVKLVSQLQLLQPQQSKQVSQENQQINQAISKMIKAIIKKLKKEDLGLLSDIKEYLNIDQSINCQQAMKSLVGEYIQSLSQASTDYSQLMQHQIEVVNSYLISKGNKLDFQIMQKLSTHNQRSSYLKSQLEKLNKYL